MSAGDTTNSSSATTTETSKDLDLSTADGHARTVEWMRNNIILPSEGETPPAMELNVKLPEDGNVTLFMDPKDHYILGFKGRDKVYLLNDKNRDSFQKHLLDQKLVEKKEDIVNIDQGADHPALGTLDRSFALAELSAANRLSKYSSKDPKQTYEDIKGPMSLLVCMIAESARLKSMEWGFRGIYFHNRVKANDAIQSYDDAKSLVALADRYFRKDMTAHAVERLQKRGKEMGQLLDGIESGLNKTDNRKQLVQDILDGKLGKQDGKLAYQIERLKEMAKELNIGKADDLTLLITKSKNEVAVEAVKDGVVGPPITLSALAK
jgi:hypothetical protein